jgi:hypothetical protein
LHILPTEALPYRRGREEGNQVELMMKTNKMSKSATQIQHQVQGRRQVQDGSRLINIDYFFGGLQAFI